MNERIGAWSEVLSLVEQVLDYRTFAFVATAGSKLRSACYTHTSLPVKAHPRHRGTPATLPRGSPLTPSFHHARWRQRRWHLSWWGSSVHGRPPVSFPSASRTTEHVISAVSSPTAPHPAVAPANHTSNRPRASQLGGLRGAIAPKRVSPGACSSRSQRRR